MKEKDIDPKDWLNMKKEEHDNQGQSSSINLPFRESRDGDHEFKVKYLYGDQQQVVTEVMSKIREWIECDDLSQFKPLRMTVAGAGGTGKSVIINTIVTLMRKMFQYDGVVKIAAPTGTAAFNVGGETFHHMTSSKPDDADYKPGDMSKERKLKLVKKFQSTLALIIDERSLASCKDLGCTAHAIAETIFGGGPFPTESWGGLPVLIMFGDDYQLPSTKEGALNALNSTKTTFMHVLGKNTFLECAENVMFLRSSKRIQKSQKANKRLIEAVRLRHDLSEPQVQKLMNLSLDEYEKKFGTNARKEVEDKAIYLFYTNSKRVRHNIRKLATVATADNPAAFLRCKGYGTTSGKAVSRHFDGNSAGKKDPAGNVQVCVNAKVALDSKNFCPL